MHAREEGLGTRLDIYNAGLHLTAEDHVARKTGVVVEIIALNWKAVAALGCLHHLTQQGQYTSNITKQAIGIGSFTSMSNSW